MREALKTPPQLAPDTLRITPLGGLGDVGRNSATFEVNGEILMVDCGVLFPDETHPGVDLILPGLHLVNDRLDDMVALVLTHGHEDHIGAVPYLLRRRPDIPVLGSKLTLAFVREKLKEHRIRNTDLREVEEGSRTRIGGFDLEFIAVNHSIPDALAVHIRTAGGSVLHTGDFKMDQLPLDGRITDLRAFAKVGEEGLDLFMVDSTNAETPGFTTLEKDIQPAMERVFAHARGKLIVACFASHVHRVQQVMDEAVKYGRKVVYVGRSMVRNMSIAAQLGYLNVPGDTLIALDDIENYADHEVVIISTGSQGEPLSALSRIANHEHPIIRAGHGDTVLLASSLIPGNENSVYRVINGLTKNGVKVVHKANALVHVSGHASAGELLYCYNIVRPRNVMPVHGEVRHLVANAELAIATGVPRENTVVVEDGEAELDERRILGEEGFISAIAVVNLHSGSLVEGPIITARGFVGAEGIFDDITAEVATALREALEEGADDTHQLQQVMRRRIGRWVSKKFRARPMIVPVVLAT